MRQVHALLMEGNGEAARRRLAALAAQEPGKADAAADVITNILWTAYDQFHIQPVTDFCRNMEKDLPPVIVERIQQALGPKIQRTAEWTAKLRGVTRERLTRECRDAIVHKNLKKSVLSAAALLERAQTEAELDDSAVLLARGLATLQCDRDAALAVIGQLMRAPSPQVRGAGSIVADQFTQMTREFKNLTFETTGGEWTQNLIEAILSFRGYLPGLMEAGEPDPSQLDKFYEEAHACMRAGLRQRSRVDFLDSLAILMEYCPVDPPISKNAAGVDERMFLKLGPRARLVAVRVITKLGELDLVRQTVLQIAKEGDPDRLRLLAAVMGGLRHPEFYPYLRQLLEKSDNRRDEARAIEAIGRIGNPDAIKTLLDRLKIAIDRIHPNRFLDNIMIYHKDPTAKELNPEERAYQVLIALGRIGRNKAIEPKMRNAMVRQIIHLVDKEDRKLAFKAATEMFSVRVGELDPDLKLWAAEKAVDAMWGQPTSQPDTPSVNGWREPMVTTLKRLGKEMLPRVLEAASKNAARYCGAMGALADALEEIGDPRAVPLLETMLRTAFLYKEDARQSQLLEEKVLDAATNQTRLLNRDEVIHGMFYALKKIGGSDGIKVILDYADQVQGGRIESPGPRTINFLVDVKVQQGKLEAKPAEVTDTAEVNAKALKQAIAQARGGLLTRKAAQIAAIAQLGQLKHLDGVGVLLELIGGKDPMVSSAAQTALAQFLHPLPAEKAYSNFLDAILEHQTLLKTRSLDKFLDFVNRELPKNPPYDKLLERQLGIMVDDGELAHRIRGALHRPKDVLERLKSTTLRRGDDPDPPDKEVYIDDDRLARQNQSQMDERRAYYEARKQWIRNGKVGDPPRSPGQ